MFYDRFIELCSKRGVSPNRACIEIGVSRTLSRRWREGGVPRGATLTKMADYFGVTSDYLLYGDAQKKPTRNAGGADIPADLTGLPDDVRELVEKLLRLEKPQLDVLAVAAEAMLRQQEK